MSKESLDWDFKESHFNDNLKAVSRVAQWIIADTEIPLVQVHTEDFLAGDEYHNQDLGLGL